MSEKRDLGEYVQQVRDSTQRYAKELLGENEKLLALATNLHRENARLEHEVGALRDQLGRYEATQSTLREQLSAMEVSNRSFLDRYADVEALNSNLANLYVASYRIHGSLDREEIVATMLEIVVNVIGSETFVILERGDDSAPMRVLGRFGVALEPVSEIRFGDGPIGAAIAGGEIVAASEGDAETDRPIACVPLKVGDRVIGAIVIFRLLAHKRQLETIDHELFELLATHAASALYCSDLHARRAAEARP